MSDVVPSGRIFQSCAGPCLPFYAAKGPIEAGRLRRYAMRSSSIVPTTTVAEVAFSNVTMQETVALILLIVQKGNSAQHICTGNLDHLYQLQNDTDFRRAYESAALV